ncbi:polyprenyl synthetase family protein [Desulfogranum japonicum]|uniref:polyprenyl synthetase family protein n=1 Tax=Desulfogranum japonicum TaxID=231447 RepID=UPI000688B5CF|nr:polyprenyl synthetase family protein [Desulfogranum japonicum]
MNKNTSEQNQNVLSLLLKEIHTPIDIAMREDISASLEGCDPDLIEIINYALFGGGKKVRPVLVAACSRLCGRDDISLYRLASAFEYLHVASLVHDDIIDNASKRRGRLSLAAKYGQEKAILAGDWLLSRSMFIIAELTGPPGLSIFCKATEGMVNGEFLQNRYVRDISLHEENYFKIIECKTGNLIASACQVGALYAGADKQQLANIGLYGQCLGSAFQIIDDILDYQGEEKNTGKTVGNDLVEGKITLPLLRALQKSSENERLEVERLIRHERELPQTYQKIFTFINTYQGFESAGTTANELIERAKNSLSLFDPAQHAEQLSILLGLADYILARNK